MSIGATDTRPEVWATLVLILAFTLCRVLLMAGLGLGMDESYTLAVSRQLQLSYFDHPPLHQWMAHVSARLLGETPLARLPFVLLFAGTSWLMFLLTRKLYGATAALWAVFGLNTAFFFLVSAGCWIVPDGPLLFALAAATIPLTTLFFGVARGSAVWRLWLGAGFWLGLAGLSKYSAIFAALGTCAFIMLTPSQRRWLRHPAPYAAGMLALIIVSPVFIWNYRNHWVSISFQTARASPGGILHLDQLGAMIAGQLALLTPWNLFPLLAGLVACFRSTSSVNQRAQFLLYLVVPPIVVFTLTPLVADQRGFPHWAMPGWFFAFPMMGVWVADNWVESGRAWLFARRSAVALAITTVLVVSQASTGWIGRLLALQPGTYDATLQAWPWTSLRDEPLLGGEGAVKPAFIIAYNWSIGGKVTIALGRNMPVFVYPSEPKGFAFLDTSARFVGRDGVIIALEHEVAVAEPTLMPFFDHIAPARFVTINRLGRPEIRVALLAAKNLKQALPVPYGR